MNITIDTVERFQGSQRKYIIYSFTVQREYQLRFLTETNFIEDGQLIDRKLNVAMTRAQEYLIMIGNRVVLSKNPLYAQLIQDYLCE
jgi:superfamily I DNA and/or RNA helicase